MRTTPRITTWLAALFAVGCAPKATFDVTVVNKSDQPVTVGVVKDGPPFEQQWATPEDVALNSRGLTGLPPWGHVIPPGRTMDSPSVTGAFPAGTTAQLRVYLGEHSNAELLATSSPSAGRADVLLFPGHNAVIVTTDAKGLHAQRVRTTAAAPK